MSDKKRKANCAGSALAVCIVIMAVLIVGFGVGLGVKTGLDTRKWRELGSAVDDCGIPKFSNQKENLEEEWSDTGLLDFSQRKDLLERLEDHSGLRPVIYATGSAYERYLTGSYAGYDIWIRNVYSAPRLKDGRDWTFWQYTDRGRLDGYAGEEPYIDLNVFNGTAEEFAAYPAR